MQDKYEIEVHSKGVHVWAQNWKGGSGLVAEFDKTQTLQELAQELYELLAAGGNEVKFKEG
jgi:hypothetical protein